MSSHTHYEILDVACSASREEIRRAFKEKILHIHPDKIKRNEKEYFCKVQTAWNVLKDKKLREAYDLSLKLRNGVMCDELQLQEMYCCKMNANDAKYVYNCKCSGQFQMKISEVDMLRLKRVLRVMLACDSCSRNIEVIL